MITYSRLQFLKKLIRGLLIAFMALIALTLGVKTVRGNGCSTCPGNGICNGEADCSKYLTDNNEGR